MTSQHLDAYEQAEADRYEYEQRAREAAERKYAAVQAMHDGGMTWAAIGRLLGVTPQRAQQLAQKVS